MDELLALKTKLGPFLGPLIGTIISIGGSAGATTYLIARSQPAINQEIIQRLDKNDKDIEMLKELRGDIKALTFKVDGVSRQLDTVIVYTRK